MVDFGILAIVLVSAVMAYFRGLIRELGTILTWISAAVIALFLFPYGREVARGVIPVPVLADIVAGAVLFGLALLPLVILSSMLFSKFTGREPGTADRILGTLFGVFRGFFLVAIGYWASMQIVPPGKEPAWIENAFTFPIVKSIAVILPKRTVYVDETTNSGQEESRNGADAKTPPENGASSEASGDANGYPQNDRRSLDQLITTTNDE